MKMYGIANCDTVKKAQKFLNARQATYAFHDFKKEGLDLALLQSWLNKVPLETLVNKRSTSWKQLDNAQQQALLAGELGLLIQRPTLIKRPVLVVGDTLLVGFEQARYDALFS